VPICFSPNLIDIALLFSPGYLQPANKISNITENSQQKHILLLSFPIDFYLPARNFYD